MKVQNGKGEVELGQGDSVKVLGVEAVVLNFKKVRVGKRTYETVALCQTKHGTCVGYREEIVLLRKA